MSYLQGSVIFAVCGDNWVLYFEASIKKGDLAGCLHLQFPSHDSVRGQSGQRLTGGGLN